MPTTDNSICFLFDNGSLRAASTLSLRRVAAGLEPLLGVPVRPVSLLHSSGVPVSELDGIPAELLEPALEAYFSTAAGGTAVALPLFFGPSAALTEYLPARLEAVQAKHPGARLQLARELVDPSQPEDLRVAAMLADAVRTIMTTRGLVRPAVILVDHGSPQPKVTAVREFIGRQLRALLGGSVSVVGTAAMERREGPAYAFNDPLLAQALRTPPFNSGDVVLALQFLSPGRHAGPGGDLARICHEAETGGRGLRTHLTEPLSGHPGLPAILADRHRESLRTNFSAQ